MGQKKSQHCTGLRLPIPEWPEDMVSLFHLILPAARTSFLEDVTVNRAQFEQPVMMGRRTWSEEHVFKLLRSCVSVELFKEQPFTMIYDALLGAAETDAWYETEKKFVEPNHLERPKE